MDRPRVVIGFLGTKLDAGLAEKRWARWRPSVALCMQPDMPVARLDLLHDNHAEALAAVVASDVARVSPATAVRFHRVNLRQPWDFEEVYGALHDFARGYPFDPEAEDYLVNITTGTHVAQICWFLLVESCHVPAKILRRGRRSAA